MDKTILAMVAVSLVILGGVPLAMASSGSSPTMTAKTFGNFAVSYSNGTGFIGSVNYTGEDYSTMLSDGIYLNGSSSATAAFSNQTSFDNNNAVMFGIEEPAVFGVMTYTKATSGANISIHSKASVSLAKQNVSFTNLISETSTGQEFSMLSGMGLKVNIFTVQTSSFTGVLIMDGNSSLNMMTHTVSSDMNASITPYPLFAMFMTSGDISEKVAQYEQGKEHFSYNNTTMQVSGYFATFNLTSSGFSSLYNNRTNTELISSLSVSGNGTMGKGYSLSDMAMNTPIIKGSLFVYANQSYILAVHNNPAMQSAVAIDNATATIVVPTGSNISMFKSRSGSLSVNASEMSSNFTVQENTVIGLDHVVKAGAVNLVISGANFTELIMVQGGYVNVSGNTIKVNSTGIAVIHMVSPPGLDHAQPEIRNAILDGKVSDQLYFNGTTSLNNMTLEFNSSVSLNISSQTAGHASIRVGSNNGNHRGTDIVIFLSNQFLKGSTTVKLTFDNQSVAISANTQIFNVTSTTSAAYAVFKTQNGLLVVFHIPHFSNHTIGISAVQSTTTGPLTNGFGVYTIPVLGIAAILIVGVTFVMLGRKKKTTGEA